MSFGPIYLKKCNRKSKFCYIFTDIFKTHIKTEDFYKDIGKDIKKMFVTSNYEDNKWCSPMGKNTKVIGLMTGELKRINQYIASYT